MTESRLQTEILENGVTIRNSYLGKICLLEHKYEKLDKTTVNIRNTVSAI